MATNKEDLIGPITSRPLELYDEPPVDEEMTPLDDVIKILETTGMDRLSSIVVENGKISIYFKQSRVVELPNISGVRANG